jgi:hypothetical protein
MKKKKKKYNCKIQCLFCWILIFKKKRICKKIKLHLNNKYLKLINLFCGLLLY